MLNNQMIVKNEILWLRKNSDGKLPVKWMSPESLFDRKCTAMVKHIINVDGTQFISMSLPVRYLVLRCAAVLASAVLCCGSLVSVSVTVFRVAF